VCSPISCIYRSQPALGALKLSADVAMVDPFTLGYGMLAFLEISLINQSDEHMRDFETSMNHEPEVMQCYFVSGETDYFLVIHVVDMDGYYQFVRRAISGSGNVRHFHSRFPMKRAKFSTSVAFDEKAAEMSVRVLR
jgi:Lrp/AsnC family transcriptional regulator, leucine-responsive regulatory protein